MPMQERKEPEFVKFGVGEVVEGVLIAIDQVEVGDERKRTPRFTVRDVESGQLYSFLGTYDIATKLTRADIGHRISVRYEGEDPSVKRNGNAMRRFKVLVDTEPFGSVKGNALADGTHITDEDIPF